MSVKIKEDQASELRNLLDGIENEKESKEEDPQKAKIDVLNLPPRKEIHTNKGRTHFKFDKPFIRFITVIIFATIIVAVYYFIIG
ncbi:hypothetical protein NSA56_08130 [Oceanobacillus caeni]|uniref:Amino acid transporter n=1 Tax=Oceanobacillus caeni TaxID=405946 RepID=A0ABR5MHY6_9BACI|nr:MULTISPECIES: hypothetical protein [Bacillaceae]KKE79320.1 hypothetical protein WH51_07375 [Bacilli bacterium VT-13-104]PZD88390.1 hypothetical protein DEJ64_04250 [Bacilli bacterium]KPH73840.1 hypothetical protein AFL42_11585 [Oceanobacillus caeni]MBU8789752.1 hypothetical protein [Oceanobacillus caeni]MCR1834367.1 hypothetical protein [Oceanobacillus caeni]